MRSLFDFLKFTNTVVDQECQFTGMATVITQTNPKTKIPVSLSELLHLSAGNRWSWTRRSL
jgi:hypothetical protein